MRATNTTLAAPKAWRESSAIIAYYLHDARRAEDVVRGIRNCCEWLFDNLLLARSINWPGQPDQQVAFDRSVGFRRR
jgi:hypothetical protein